MVMGINVIAVIVGAGLADGRTWAVEVFLHDAYVV